MRRIAGFLVVASCLIGVTSLPARAASHLVIGIWPPTYAEFRAIETASGVSIPYFRGRVRDGQFDTTLVIPDAAAAAADGYSLGLNIQPKTGSGANRTGILYTTISAQIQAQSGTYYDKLVSMANEVLALPTYGVVPNYLQFHSEASTQAAPGVASAHPYSGTGPEYQECYTLIHELFDSLGVTDKIYWQIVLSRKTYVGNDGGPENWFPSDPSLYDLVGVDAYYKRPASLSPSDAFGAALAFAQSRGKQLWIDETGADEGGPLPQTATAKAAWFGAFRTYLQANLWDIAGVVFSHENDGGIWYLDSKFPADVNHPRSSPNFTGTSWNGWKAAVTALSGTAPPTRQLTVAVVGSGTGSVTSTPAGIACPGDCVESLARGDAVDLDAVAGSGSVFSGWSGDCAGTVTPCNLVINDAESVTATFELQHELTVVTDGSGTGSVTSNVGGIDCPGTCVANDLGHNTHVILTADPDPGFALAGWSGAGCTGTALTCDVTMNDDQEVTATFANAVALSVTLDGVGTVTSLPDEAINCPSTCTHDFAEDGTVTLHAEDANSIFTGWSSPDAGFACSGTGDCTVTMDIARTVEATFEPAFALHVAVTGAGAGAVTSLVPNPGIDCGVTCVHRYLAGTTVTLHAADGPNADFNSWSGDCTGAGDCNVTLDQVRTVTAAYDPIMHQLSVIKSGSGTGTVTSLAPLAGIDCGATCDLLFQQGSSVVLHASPDGTSSFAGWSGGGCTGTTDCTVTVDAVKSVNATFALAQRLLTITKLGTGTGTVTSNVGGINCGATCSADYDHGTAIVLTATPSGGGTFAGWSGGVCSGTSTTCNVTMDAAKSVTGTFNPVVTTTTIRNDDPSVAYNGWSGVVDGAANGGAYRMSNVKNDTATWTPPKTTSITWVTRTGPDQGKASVTIDGANKGTVDLYSAAPATLNKVYSGLANKAHTVVIKVLGTKNNAATGLNVRLDAFVVGATTTQESDPAIQYVTWKSSTQPLATDTTYRSASAASATVKVTFTGTSIDWITTKGKNYGKASVKIDGVSKGTFDLYQSATAWHSLVSFTGLSSGSHSMVIQVLGQKNAASTGNSIIVDGFIVHA